MTIRNILTYPEKSLLKPSDKVEIIDDEIRTLINDMGETMFDAPGVGLAAPQVGVNKRVIVYDLHAGDKDDDGITQEFKALINPEIIEASGSIISEKEGCLSVVDYNADVKRYETVVVKALDIEGNPMEFKADGIFSVIMQHEIDHLDGILFINRISVLKRSLYKKKLAKELSSN
ncbi:MAG: peptide deformylase [Desulfobacula sp.]|jgi:peptide deformylase